MFLSIFCKPKKYLNVVFFLLSIVTFFNPHAYSHTNTGSQKILTYAQLCMCDFCKEIRATESTEAYKIINHQLYEKKNYKQLKKIKKQKRTIIIYMAADNDLRIFAARNIQQMAAIGSNENVTILIHLDIRISGNKKITRRYLVEKDQVLHIEPYNILTQQMDSGNPATLISCCEWAINNYPAEEYDLILWNHGTGVLEPMPGKVINPMDLFVFNPTTHLLELDRSIGFLEAMSKDSTNQRGICWDDSTGNYLTNKKLDVALQTIRQKHLNGKKFGIIGFDACLMSMVEVGSFIKKHAMIMTGSQEVELGMGWKYDEVLFPFLTDTLDAHTFARHIVASYEKTYQPITYDYTLSAIDLENINKLEQKIDEISSLLISSLSNNKSTYNRIIRESRNKHLCTHFDEPSYIDLHHFFHNLIINIQKLDQSSSPNTKSTLITKLVEGITLLEKTVIANTTGRNLKNARGLSIYFPEKNIHSSYKEAAFLEKNNWGTFLSRYLFG